MAKFTVFKGTDYHYYFNFKAGNGEIVIGSEAYVQKQSCLEGIAAVKYNAPYDANYERKISINGQYYFVLKAGNHLVIGKSQMYTTTYARELGITAVKRDAPIAITEDLT